MGVNHRSQILGEGIPVNEKRSFSDLLAEPGTDHVHAEDGAVGSPGRPDDSAGTENLTLAVSGEGVVINPYIVFSVLGDCLRFGWAYRCDLGVTACDPRHSG